MKQYKLATLIMSSGLAVGTLGQAPMAEANNRNQTQLVTKSGAPKPRTNGIQGAKKTGRGLGRPLTRKDTKTPGGLVTQSYKEATKTSSEGYVETTKTRSYVPRYNHHGVHTHTVSLEERTIVSPDGSSTTTAALEIRLAGMAGNEPQWVAVDRDANGRVYPGANFGYHSVALKIDYDASHLLELAQSIGEPWRAALAKGLGIKEDARR